MSKKSTSPEDKYKKAVAMADSISKGMSFIYANYEILRHSSEHGLKDKVIGTYAGNAWQTLRRTILNEIHLGISRVLVDDDKRVASLPRLYTLVQDKDVIDFMEKNYTQGAGTFKPRIRQLQSGLKKLMAELKDKDSSLKPLIQHRNTRMAHAALKPYSGAVSLKWGDEENLIKLLEKIIDPMENLLLNAGNISGSTRSAYSKYAKDLWSSFEPKRDYKE